MFIGLALEKREYERAAGREKGRTGQKADISTQYWIIRGKFPASRGSVFLITLVAFMLIISSLVIVITIEPSVFEKR